MEERSSAIVTGASSGIGRAIALMLHELGFNVLGIGRHFADVIPFQKIEADITDAKWQKSFADMVLEYHPEILVNCAGVGYYGLHEDISPVDIAAMCRTDLEAPMILTAAALKDMKRMKRGTIINISSVVATKASTYAAAYAATKAGLSSFTQSIFEESRKYGIRIVDISPDMTKSNFYRNADFTEDDDAEAYLLPEDVAQAVKDVLSMRDGITVTKMTIRPRYHRVKRREKQ